MSDILIVDDDEVFGALSLERFENSRWTVHFHLGPFGTVNAIRATRPRLVIIDVNMPGLPGTSVSLLVRKTPRLGRVKILLYSSMDQRTLDGLVKEHGADDALTKSATKSQLLAKVAKMIEGVESHRTS
ncbi:MAG TPA: response regulator [Polyangiaceae bacterium]|jgi:PleD family two-component response regulator|nr:response regulator [Polyangiaceae bacterium]